MFQVPHFDVEHHVTEVGRAGDEAHMVDIGAGLADDRGDRSESARLVDGGYDDLRRKEILAFLVEVPAHVEPAFRLIVEGGERRRLNGIDRDPFAGSQNADDPVAGDGAAVGGETNRQVAVEAADRNGVARQRQVPPPAP